MEFYTIFSIGIQFSAMKNPGYKKRAPSRYFIPLNKSYEYPYSCKYPIEEPMGINIIKPTSSQQWVFCASEYLNGLEKKTLPSIFFWTIKPLLCSSVETLQGRERGPFVDGPDGFIHLLSFSFLHVRPCPLQNTSSE